MRHLLDWTVGHTNTLGEKPAKMVKATVPGNANLDWAVAENMPEWKYGVNFKQYKWMEDCWWLYEAALPQINLQAGEKLFFVTEGIDYQYHIMLNGKTLCEHEGMFSSVELPLDSHCDNGGNDLLQIWIAPPPKDPLGYKDTRDEASQSCKPAVSYGWDFHPRLIPVGIWDETYLEVRSAAYIIEADVEYTLAADFSEVSISFKSKIEGSGEVAFTLYNPDGTVVMRALGGDTSTLTAPKLWWCNGYGAPNLYRWEAVLSVDGHATDKQSGHIGFRILELEMNEGTWSEPREFPMGRSPAPITITLNGVPVFAKGSNWVNPDVFTGTLTREIYHQQIEMAKAANFNILRCWGGAIVNKQAFFDICDEYGILVWQEFPLACNNYRGTPHYLKVLEQEASAIIKKLKHHPCLAIWCGGNELFNNWSKMTDQSAALRLLNKLCYELDPPRPFLATSPLFGMAHGCYTFRYPDGREVFQVMPAAHNTAYTEFGVPSISNLECCLRIADEKALFPLEEKEVTVEHHAFYAWVGKGPWAYTDIIEDYFGKAQSLPQLIEWSQWMQGEGYKCIFEEARRQKPYCSMAINWCYNEPWPTLANNSIINYPSQPKSSFVEVAAACRGALISARLPKFSWRSGETFSADIWLLNDGVNPIEAGEAEILLELAGTTYRLHQWKYGEIEANTNLEGPTVRLKLPESIKEANAAIAALNQGDVQREKGRLHEMKLIINAGDMSSCYRLLFNE
ncbi:MAG: hypothetical protein FWD03_00985 [Defluviitaleaceae bacterium]|nr:hypothetical protein [Defluviitaleaceae bacterium]